MGYGGNNRETAVYTIHNRRPAWLKINWTKNVFNVLLKLNQSIKVVHMGIDASRAAVVPAALQKDTIVIIIITITPPVRDGVSFI